MSSQTFSECEIDGLVMLDIPDTNHLKSKCISWDASCNKAIGIFCDIKAYIIGSSSYECSWISKICCRQFINMHILKNVEKL